jgi:hypothetical protein
MIFFVVAFLAECFHRSGSGTVPLIPVSVTSFTVLVLVMWSLQTLGNSTLEIRKRWNRAAEWIKRRVLTVMCFFSRLSDSRLQAAAV